MINPINSPKGQRFQGASSIPVTKTEAMKPLLRSALGWQISGFPYGTYIIYLCVYIMYIYNIYICTYNHIHVQECDYSLIDYFNIYINVIYISIYVCDL